jgi:transposase
MDGYTIVDLEKEFPDDNTCLEWLKNYLYSDGIFCDKCGRITKHHKITSRHSYSCDVCGNHVHPTVGTIFEKSTTPLKLWFHAIFLMSSTRCGISAKQLQRETGVTYKTAWRMFKQIRSLLNEDTGKLSGKVEADETYIGGTRHGKRGRGASGKTIVAGVVERQEKVIANVVPNVQSTTLLPLIFEKTTPDTIIFTDEMPSYNKLDKIGYDHQVIHHADKVYVMGDIHTNTIDGFWSLVKRGINGVYHSVSPDYLQSYVNEYAFRYSHRKDETPMFTIMLQRIQRI